MRTVAQRLWGRRWRRIAGLLVVLAIVGTVAGVRWAAAGHGISKAAGAPDVQSATATPVFGMQAPAAADTLTVEVTKLQRGVPVGVVFSRTLRDQATVERVRLDLETAMPQVIGPTTNTSCPAATGDIAYTYALRFFSGGTLVERASGNTLSLCGFWTIETRDATVVRCCPDVLLSAYHPQVAAPFWTLLRQETGAPLPPTGQPE